MVKYQIKKRVRLDDDLRKMDSRPWTKDFLDLDESSVFGRTAKSWCFILLFFTIFYAVLAALFAICYHVFITNLDLDVPRVLMKQPGMSYEPSYTVDVTNFIKYKEKSLSDIKTILAKIAQNHNKYGEEGPTYFAPCSPNDDYGYTTRNPCIFLKINRIIGFKAETYGHIFDLPRAATPELRNYIGSLPAAEQKDRIWISCETNKSLELGYYPHRYVPAGAVQIEKKKLYGKSNFYSQLDFQRIVAVQLKAVPPDQTLKISCYMWAKNIEIDKDREDGKGMVEFLLHIDSSKVKFRGDGDHYRLNL